MGSIRFETTRTRERVVVLSNEYGTIVCAGTTGGIDVEDACAGILRSYVESGATAPVYVFVDQTQAMVRQLVGVDQVVA